jgi:hypothetical protein
MKKLFLVSTLSLLSFQVQAEWKQLNMDEVSEWTRLCVSILAHQQKEDRYGTMWNVDFRRDDQKRENESIFASLDSTEYSLEDWAFHSSYVETRRGTLEMKLSAMATPKQNGWEQKESKRIHLACRWYGTSRDELIMPHIIFRLNKKGVATDAMQYSDGGWTDYKVDPDEDRFN